MIYYEEHDYPHMMPVEANIFRDFSVLAHWHADFELVLCISGSVRVGINSENRTLERGDIAVVSVGDIHYISSASEDSSMYSIIFRPEIVEGITGFISQPEVIAPFICSDTIEGIGLSEERFGVIQFIFNTIHDELARREPFSEIIVKSKLAELSGLLFRYTTEKKPSPAEPTSLSDRMHLVREAIRFINKHFGEEISLDDVADHLHISPYYFSRMFSKATGMTYKSFLNSTRVHSAERLLKSTNEPVTSIAYECGFGSIRTFNRVFREYKGVAPSEYRK